VDGTQMPEACCRKKRVGEVFCNCLRGIKDN
jgi:hypothetical protein